MKLTDENLLIMAMHAYDNCQLNTVDEFQQDINRIYCIQKLIERYLNSKTGSINIRLVMNHCIILRNSFGELVPQMFRVKFPKHYLAVIRPVVEYLQMIRCGDWDDVEFDDTINLLLEQI